MKRGDKLIVAGHFARCMGVQKKTGLVHVKHWRDRYHAGCTWLFSAELCEVVPG